MPRRYTRKRRFRRRKFTPNLAIWPRSVVRKSTIVNSTAFGTGAGTLNAIIIKINSLNDPFGGSGTNLPLGLDEASRVYQRYRILGAKMTVVGHPVTITGGAIHGLHITRESSALTDMDHYRELKGTVSRMVSPDIDIFKMGMKYSPKKFYRGKYNDIKDTEDLSASLIGTGSIGNPAPADPTELCYIHLWLQDLNRTDAVSSEFSIRIDYIIQLLDPVTPSRSSM